MKKLSTITIIIFTLIFLAACTTKSPISSTPESTSATPTSISSPNTQVDNCVGCHTDKQMLIDTASPEIVTIDLESLNNSLGGSVDPMEAWEKVLVNASYLENVHGQTSCSACHAGNSSSNDKELAHTGLITAPDAEAQRTCGNCHNEIVSTNAKSLHTTQAGFFQAIYSRSVPDNHPALDQMYSDLRQSFQTTCGDCHVSRPDHVGGGLLNGHEFVKTPPMDQTCNACHGALVGNEFLGENVSNLADVHSRQEKMNCVDCHEGASMHDSEGSNHRYEGEQGPSCESCHDQVGRTSDTIIQHQIHQGSLSCQVCHSTSYTNCDSCHVSVDESTDTPSFTIDEPYLSFLIGQNSRQSTERPYKYVPVRHIPIEPDSFEYYGDNLLPNFNLLPTWAYTTPHNIQRYTPQSKTCNSCHGNEEIFLTSDKVNPEELEANRNVIVDSVPGLIPEQ